MKCLDLHKQVTSPTPPLLRVGGDQVQINLCARNWMKYPDLNRNIMHENLNPLRWSLGSIYRSLLLRGQVQKIFAGKCMKNPHLNRKIMYETTVLKAGLGLGSV